MYDSVSLTNQYPGLVIDKNRNGTARFRVRVQGTASRRVTLPFGPDNPNFYRYYQKARQGLLLHEETWMKSGMGDKHIVRARVTRMLAGAKQRAVASSREFDLEVDDVLKLLSDQNCRCALSGIEFDLSPSATRRKPYAPSLDRISAKGGYTKGNVRLLCVVVNLALGDWGDEVLQAVARHIVLHGVPHTPKGVPPEISLLAMAFENKRKSGPRK